MTVMFGTIRSWLRLAWPFVGTAYLCYLALQAPPIRYVGVIGLVFVVPLLVGWIAGRVFDVGPWADDHTD
jgi:hypothetical protein